MIYFDYKSRVKSKNEISTVCLSAEDRRVMQKVTEKCLIYILEAELVKALGCTEPIAIAYASATAKRYLGSIPEKIIISCSGNIMKNAKAVMVPMTEGMKGIEAASIAGTVGGDPDRGLEVLTTVTEQDLQIVRLMLQEKVCQVELLDTWEKLHIVVRMSQEKNEVKVELLRSHLGIVRIEKNGGSFLKRNWNVRKNLQITAVWIWIPYLNLQNRSTFKK